MPGIFVERRNADLLQVTVPYYQPYSNRIREIDGARWGGENDPYWILPIESAEDLDIEFEGELIYTTPKGELIEGIKPPRTPAVYKEVPRITVKDLKVKPHSFQTFGMNFCAYLAKKIGFAMLGDLMGTGKTFQGIGTAKLLKQQGKVNKVLVVVLAPTRLQWQKEIRKFTDEESYVFSDFKAKYRQKDGKRYVAETIDDQKMKAIEEFNASDTMFMIMSYQGMQQNAHIIEKANFDMVIFDEAHYMKARTSKTNKAAKQIVRKRTPKSKKGKYTGIPHTLFISGTPIMNYPDEIFGLIGIVSDKYFGSFREFKKRYLTLNQYKDVVGYRNLDELTEKTKGFLIRRTDKEIGLNLPPMIEQDIDVEAHPKQLKLDASLISRQSMIMDTVRTLRAQGKKMEAQQTQEQIKLIKMQRIAAACHPNLFGMSKSVGVRKKYQEYMVKNEYDVPKFERCMEMVKEIVGNGHKVVVFVESRRMTAMLHKEIKKFTRAVRYIGGLSDQVRERRKEKFNTDPSCKVMIANGAGSTGLNLQAGRYLINYDLPHNPAIWEQRKYRIRRLDSKHKTVFIYNLIAKGTVDEQMREKLKEKQASFNGTIENDESQTKMHQQMIQGKERKRKRKKTVIRDDDEW